MKIAIFGAGAIGGYMGARLAASGADVTLIARGPHLAAMQKDGLRLIEHDGSESVTHPHLAADSREAGPHDYVILAVKAHSVSPALDAITPLIGPETAVVTAQNGVPWWYFYGIEGPHRDRHLESVDPGGRIWDTIGPQRAIGCVVYPACEIERPGVIRHDDDENRFSLGEPDNSRSDRASALASALNAAGLRAPLRRNIRGEIWVKLWGNVAMNPISALTRATLAQIGAEPATRTFARNVMLEVEAVANALGEKMAVDVDARLNGAIEVGEHKTSMLQDLELGRPMEVDAIVSAVLELARITETPTPYLDALDGMVRLLVANRG
ncbi:MAG TPA: 2-dehydropantoate 2-reductase [Dehalococcoidia bacterium]|nr:2-dehydropantoate 2-reductase [Dehalococcoidia bacterium]